jgi:hypothetical protein
MNFKLTDNRYANRRIINDMIDSINTKCFEKCKASGWHPLIRADVHVADRLSDREFPCEEFYVILKRLATLHEDEILSMCNDVLEGNPKPIRINVYGHGAWMVGVTINVFDHHKTFHINVRTCYKERNMTHRCRNVDVKRIFTRGVPEWISNPSEYVEPTFSKEGDK